MKASPPRRPSAGTILIAAGLALSSLVFVQAARDPLPLTALDSAGAIFLQKGGRGEFRPLSAGGVIRSGDIVRTSPHAFLELGLPDDWNVRISEESEAVVYPPRLYESAGTHRIELKNGVLFAASKRRPRENSLSVKAGTVEFSPSAGAFSLQVSGSRFVAASILKGKSSARSPGSSGISAGPRESIHLKDGALEKQPLNFQAWRRAFRAYLLTPRPEDYRKEQLALASRSGSLFTHAYYLGEFYTDEQGYLETHFIPEADGARAEIFYDLRHAGAFAGLYAQTNELYLDRYGRFTFEARRSPGLEPPGAFQVEFKNQHKIVRSIRVENLAEEWTPHALELDLSSSAPVTEIVVIVFQRDAGAGGQGGFELRRLELHPRAASEKEARP